MNDNNQEPVKIIKSENQEVKKDFKKFKSIDVNIFNSGKIEDKADKILLKFKTIDKNKFSKIPKNEKLMNYSIIIQNDNKLKFHYFENILNNIYLRGGNIETTNIKKYVNDNNLKTTSLIPVTKKTHKLNKKGKKSKRKGSYESLDNAEWKKSHSKFNSSHILGKAKLKNEKKISHRKYSEADNSKQPIKIGEYILNKNDKPNIKNNDNKDNYNKENNDKENNGKENLNNDNKDKDNKDKDNKDKDNEGTKVNTADIKKKEIVKLSIKAKKRRYRGFPLCCFIVEEDNSFDDT